MKRLGPIAFVALIWSMHSHAHARIVFFGRMREKREGVPLPSGTDIVEVLVGEPLDTNHKITCCAVGFKAFGLLKHHLSGAFEPRELGAVDEISSSEESIHEIGKVNEHGESNKIFYVHLRHVRGSL